MDGKLYFAGEILAQLQRFSKALIHRLDHGKLFHLLLLQNGISMSAYNGKLYVFGGSTAGDLAISWTVWKFTTRLRILGLPVRTYLLPAITRLPAYGDKILVFGGWDQAEDNMDQVLEFDQV